MIVVVQRPSYKKLAVKFIAFCAFCALGTWYYFESEKKVVELQKQTIEKKVTDKKEQRAKVLEKLIVREAEICVELLNQAKVEQIGIVDDKLLIVCDVDTDLEPLMIRYGANAMIKNSVQNVKVAIDLSYIVEGKYEES